MFEIYKNKRILITGVTGFKGSWLALWLKKTGAIVSGFGLEPDTKPSLFKETGLDRDSSFIIADIRKKHDLTWIFNKYLPEIVFHLASQPLVTVSYENPSETFETNSQGLVNLCEVIRESGSVKQVLFVTSDKCYKNDDDKRLFDEDDPLGGTDPYSASKACAEIIAASYANSFFVKKGISSATLRAGNIIGGGDWSRDRLIPDIIRAYYENKTLIIRNPNHVRPWQHVLEALAGYLKAGEYLIGKDKEDFSSWNFGPDGNRDFRVEDIVELFTKDLGKTLNIKIPDSDKVYESRYLQLNSSKAIKFLGWKNLWDTFAALKKTSEWYTRFYSGGNDAAGLCRQQINEYENLMEF